MKLVAFAHAYRQNSVQTASPGQLVLMLFDGALRFMNRALQGFDQEEIAARNEAVHVNLVKAQAIIDELQASISYEPNGEFASNLSALYTFMRSQLRAANVRKEPTPIQTVLELLADLRSGWSAMLSQQESHDSSATASAA